MLPNPLAYRNNENALQTTKAVDKANCPPLHAGLATGPLLTNG